MRGDLDMKEQLELVPYLWPLTTYKIGEQYKRIFGEPVTVKTSHGPITGVKYASCYGMHYINFLGVPYAKPPVGNLRFRDPEPCEPWTEPLNATKETIAAQHNIVFSKYMGSEDCLHLNIFTKNLNPKTLSPVMVFLHGGAFVFGSNSKDFYSPEFLLRKDVILIVANYRLGVFGFLSIDDPKFEIPGNAGLKDQTMALKWIKENCERFGGDPNNITLFGESAGACSTHYHCISDFSKGLFHKAIIMSGSALNPWSIGPLQNIPQRLAKSMGWNGSGGMEAVMQILQHAKPESLIKAQNLLLGKEERKLFIFTPFGPVIEPYRSKQCFIDRHPALMCLDPWTRHMPIMIGGCSFEGLLVYKVLKKKPSSILKYGRALERVVPFQIEPDRNSERCKQFGLDIKKLYFGYTDPSMATVNAYMTMLGDKEFWHGIHRTLVSRSRNGGQTYLYRFDFDSHVANFSKIFFAGKNLKGFEGACHGDDCFYLFRNAIGSKMNEKSKEFQAMEHMVTLWTTFAQTGNPNSNSIKLANNETWEPINGKRPFKCLNINHNLTFVDLPESERMGVWDSIYENAVFN